MSNHDRKGSPSQVRDVQLDRAWSLASDEQPPVSLDAAIIAAARDSTQSRDEPAKVSRLRPRSWNGLTSWQPFAAAAAVTGLAFVLLQSLPRDEDVASPTQMNEQTAVPAAAPQVPDGRVTPEAMEAKATASAERAGASAPLAAPEPERRQRDVVAQDAIAPIVPAPPLESDASETSVTAEDSATMRAEEFDRRKATATDMAGRSAPAPAAAASAPARDDALRESAESSAVDWVNRIEAQHASGDLKGAADTLRSFRAAESDADEYLPESLRGWAQTVE